MKKLAYIQALRRWLRRIPEHEVPCYPASDGSRTKRVSLLSMMLKPELSLPGNGEVLARLLDPKAGPETLEVLLRVVQEEFRPKIVHAYQLLEGSTSGFSLLRRVLLEGGRVLHEDQSHRSEVVDDGDQAVGLRVRMMGQAMRELAYDPGRRQTTILFSSQIREKVGVVFGSVNGLTVTACVGSRPPSGVVVTVPERRLTFVAPGGDRPTKWLLAGEPGTELTLAEVLEPGPAGGLFYHAVLATHWAAHDRAGSVRTATQIRTQVEYVDAQIASQKLVPGGLVDGVRIVLGPGRVVVTVPERRLTFVAPGGDHPTKWLLAGEPGTELTLAEVLEQAPDDDVCHIVMRAHRAACDGAGRSATIALAAEWGRALQSIESHGMAAMRSPGIAVEGGRR